MSGPTRTVTYEGLYPSQIQERFDRDAADAALDDWYPTAESWQGGVLQVTYAHDPGRREREAMAAPPVAPQASTSQREPTTARGPMPGWQRGAIALVVLAVVLFAGSMTLVGFGGWDRPGTVPGDPVAVATPAPGGLGPRAAAVAFLESAGFEGQVSPVGDGQEHWLGRGPDGSVAELLGPASGLLRATVTVFPTEDVGVGEIAQPTEVLKFLDQFAPGASAWATAHTDDAVAARGMPVRGRFGDRLVTVSALDGEDASVFTYAVTQAEARARARRTPRPTTVARTFSEGTWEVGVELKPGTYRATATGDCDWARLSDASGLPTAVLGSATGSGSRLVTIGKRDVAFTSTGCGRWTSDLSRVTEDRTTFGEGTFLVGDDVAAGRYASDGTGACAWTRLSGFGGTSGEVVAAGAGIGPQEVTVRASDAGFSSSGCGTWTRR